MVTERGGSVEKYGSGRGKCQWFRFMEEMRRRSDSRWLFVKQGGRRFGLVMRFGVVSLATKKICRPRG